MKIIKQLVFKSCNLVRKLPMNYSENDNYLFRNEITREINTTYAFIYSKVIIDSNCRKYHWLCKLPELQIGISRLKAWVKIFVAKNTVMKISKVLILTDENSGNYFHWLLDVMPKIQVLKEAGGCNGHTLLLPVFAQQSFVFAFLKFYPELKIFPLKENLLIKAAECYQLGEIAQTGNYRPEKIYALKHYLLSFLKIQPIYPGRKIWISRKKALKRKIENEDEIVEILTKYKWEVLFMEDYDVSQQIEIIGHSSAIGGMSGAGLSNAIFLQSESPLFEIRYPKDSHTNCFYSLADANRNPYFYLEAEPTINGQNSHNGNVFVNCLKFEKIIIQIEKILKINYLK